MQQLSSQIASPITAAATATAYFLIALRWSQGCSSRVLAPARQFIEINSDLDGVTFSINHLRISAYQRPVIKHCSNYCVLITLSLSPISRTPNPHKLLYIDASSMDPTHSGTEISNSSQHSSEAICNVPRQRHQTFESAADVSHWKPAGKELSSGT